jgi:hypothetical protein
MENQSVGQFFQGAKGLSGSPLGIIALFILLVYGFAALTFGLSIGKLGEERLIIIWFLVGFPVLVLFVFTLLVIYHHRKLYGPTDFANQEDFLKLQEQLERSEKKVQILQEVSNVAVDLEPPTEKFERKKLRRTVKHSDDPQKELWGGKREDNFRKIAVGKISPLKSDPDYFNVPLKVTSTDPENHPLDGVVKFHLHDTFDPDVEEVEVAHGTAKLNLVSYGAFTVGVETEDGTKLEIDLSDDDIPAPRKFKER